MSSVRDKRRRLECVLAVDDEEDIQRIVRISLERLGGIRVHACTDPRRAIEMAREVLPDLILLDYVMPGLDGATLFKRFKADPALAGIPVVFLTASATGLQSKELKTLGAAGVLIKPYSVQELPRKLSEIWERLNAAVSESEPPISNPPLD